MITKFCICGSLLKKLPSSRYKTGRGKYCSKKCFFASKKGVALPHLFNVQFKEGQTTGNKNIRWKGDNVGYSGIHRWVQKVLGKATKCNFSSDHIAKKYEWANVSGSYLRDTGDWTQLCTTCHRQYDYLLNRSAKPIFNSKRERIINYA